MGICISTESVDVCTTTAKLILQDGGLQEFPHPVKVSHVLQKDPTCFICNSDEMEFDNVVEAIDGDEELQLGQLYFALPLSRLKRKMQAQEMAALAVKANSALMKSAGRGGMFGSSNGLVCPVVVSGEKVFKVGGSGGGGGGNGGGGVAGGGGRRRRRRSFVHNLSAIAE